MPPAYLYLCVDDAAAAGQAARRGLHATTPLPAWTRLEEAQAHCAGMLLVVDAARLEAPLDALYAVPPSALLNADPYRPPQPVAAAGGVVARPGGGGTEVLLIHRRGVWDLPKGKLEAGESLEACARREVGEELGIARVELTAPLGTTQHAYPEHDYFCIKTTHWYAMRTTATHFAPQAGEGIDAVAWVPLETALAQVGFATLRAPLQRLAAQGDPFLHRPPPLA